MLSELQTKNISQTFKLIDSNDNGAVEEADFIAMAERILDGLNLEEQSDHRDKVRDTLTAWWEEIRTRADTNENGQVGKSEYLAAAEKGMLSDTPYLDALTKVADSIFDAADRDADGYLTQEEFAGIHLSAGADNSQAAAAFGQLDTDGDGRINRDEYRAMAIGTFTSTTPDTAGANVFGYA